MNILQMIKDYLEECVQRNEMVEPETLLEEIGSWESDNVDWRSTILLLVFCSNYGNTSIIYCIIWQRLIIVNYCQNCNDAKKHDKNGLLTIILFLAFLS